MVLEALCMLALRRGHGAEVLQLAPHLGGDPPLGPLCLELREALLCDLLTLLRVLESGGGRCEACCRIRNSGNSAVGGKRLTFSSALQ